MGTKRRYADASTGVSMILAKLIPEPHVTEHIFARPRRFRFDIAWVGPMIAVEINGRGRHQSWTGYTTDLEKMRIATKAGWRVLQYTADDARNRLGMIADDVRELLEQRR